MPITGRFLADFTDFQSAVQKAEVSLKSFATGSGKVETALSRMTQSFTGTKVIQDATLMAEAVERIGGVSKLTASELAAVSSKAAEAAAKLRAMGQDVPPGLQKIADATTKVGGSLQSMKGMLGSVAGAFGIAFSIGAVVNFGKSVFDSASQIHDMALKLGVSAEAVQGFKFAAEQAGSSIDAVGTAITRMNANLAGGDKATVQALTDAGLSFAAIRAMKPEDAFLAITDAIQKIPDPMTQSDVALQLFGKSAAELMPAIKEGLRGVADGADKMSTDTVNSLERAQDAWSQLGAKVTIVTGTMIANFMKSMESGSDMVERFAGKVMGLSEAEIAGGMAARKHADGAAAATDAANKLGPALHQTKEELDALDVAHKKAGEAAAAHAKAIQDLADQYSGMAAIDTAADAMAAYTRNLKNGVTVAQMTVAQQAALNKTLQAAIDAYAAYGVEAPAALGAVYAATLRLPPVISGLTSEFDKLGIKIAVTIPVLDDFTSKLKYIDGLPAGAKLGTHIAVVAPKVRDATAALSELSQSLTQLAQISGSVFGSMFRDIAAIVSGLDAAAKANERWKGHAGIASALFTDESSKTEKAAAALASGAAIAAGVMAVWSASANDASKAAGAFHGALGGAQAGAAFGPWGAAIGAAGGALLGFIHTLSAGRRAVQDFAATAGGFDSLREQLLILGDEGERLWIKLTQGTKKGDKAGAAAVINEITAALEKQRLATQKAADAAGAAGDAQVAASQKALDAIKGMDDQIKSLSDSIAGEAPEEFMGIVEAQTRAKIEAIQKERTAAQAALDDTVGASADAAKEAGDIIDQALKERQFIIRVKAEIEGLPGLPSLNSAASGNGGGSTRVVIENKTYLDGKQIAESTAEELLG